MTDNKEILKFCMEKGFLVDNDLLNIFSETSDIDSIKLIIEKIKTYSGKNVLTKNIFQENKDQVSKVLNRLPEDKQKNLEKLKIKLGLSIEVSRDDSFENFSEKSSKNLENVKILCSDSNQYDEKLGVKHFVNYFRKRFDYMKNILIERSELENLVSIDKLSGNKQGISIIGIVYNKRVTKNKNIILEVEDNTGRIKVLISKSKEDLYNVAEEISLDSVLGFKCSGNNEILFANEIFFPDSRLPERKKSLNQEYALFIGDLHFGSKRFLEKSFMKFIDYLNSDEAKNIKYLFLVGDIVTGVGNYPNQEQDLLISDLEEQFLKLANIFKSIPKHIKLILSPGNHDGVRIMEPQPIFDEKYAWPIYQLDNVIVTENPCYVNIASDPEKGFDGINVLTYHGYSFPHYANNVPSLIIKKAMNCPEEIMKYLLKNRHLAPAHGSTQYYPHKEDKLIIKDIPDIFVAAHTHKGAITYYNNTMIVSTSCWESMSPYQEKFGNEPDHCKVPLINLKTRAVKILDFEDKNDN